MKTVISTALLLLAMCAATYLDTSQNQHSTSSISAYCYTRTVELDLCDIQKLSGATH